MSSCESADGFSSPGVGVGVPVALAVLVVVVVVVAVVVAAAGVGVGAAGGGGGACRFCLDGACCWLMLCRGAGWGWGGGGVGLCGFFATSSTPFIFAMPFTGCAGSSFAGVGVLEVGLGERDGSEFTGVTLRDKKD